MLRLRIRSDNLSNAPRAPAPADPRVMRMDAQTFRDLEIFEAATGASLYDLCNEARTSGGAKLLRARMRRPWCRPEKIRAVQDSVTFILANRDAFDRLPWEISTKGIQRYLRRNLPLAANVSRLGLFVSSIEMRFTDTRTLWRMLQGVLSVTSMLRSLRALLAELGPAEAQGELRGPLEEMRRLIDDPEIAHIETERERWDLPSWTVLSLDRTLRMHARPTVERLLHLVYQVDALVSMADTVQRHGFVIPELQDGPLGVEAEGVYHPFLPSAVPNPVRLRQERRMLFLTGPNMAGKTTYLRAAGMAVYLAHLGMGVPARAFRFSPCKQLFTSIIITDDVRTGISFFRAEALRMKAIAQGVADGDGVIALMDEPFKGTNLKDALDASREILERLAEREGNLFMVASHLIELGEHMIATGQVDCQFFEASEDGGRLRFDYILRPGLSSQRLGMRVLREEGIFDLLDGAATPTAP